ncbi:hypothetical protein ScPMuIL_018801 [Solemya velum]
MTGRNSRAPGGPKQPLQILELSFEGNVGIPQDYDRPSFTVKKGVRRYPLSLYSFDKEPEYQQDVYEEVDRLIEDDYLAARSSPSWAIDTSKEVTHSGESPLYIHRLLSPSKTENGYQHNFRLEKSLLRDRRLATPPKRPRTSYYRANRTHQYLSATELRNHSVSEVNLLYGRPTRTTLLRARHRCNSAPSASLDSRREIVLSKSSTSTMSPYHFASRNMIHFYTESGESMHSFLVGSRYNRAHFFDAKGLSSYGVYMPRNNPKGCFMTGRLNVRSDETPAAPPESPSSDIDDESVPFTKDNRPMSGRSTPGGRPRSSHKNNSSRPTSGRSSQKIRSRGAWGDNTTTCNIYQSENNKENFDSDNKDQLKEELIILPGTRVVPSRGQKLPSVHGVAVSRAHKSHEEIDELLIVNKPPPTPVGTRENTEELLILGTQSTITQDTQSKEPISEADRTNSATPNEKALPDNPMAKPDPDLEPGTKQESKSTNTEEKLQQGLVEDIIAKDVVNKAEVDNIKTEATGETIGESLCEKVSELLDNIEPVKDKNSKVDPTQTQTLQNADIKDEGSVDPKPVTDVKCDVKIFITEDGEETKPYEHEDV